MKRIFVPLLLCLYFPGLAQNGQAVKPGTPLNDQKKAQMLAEKCQGKLDDEAEHYFDRVCSETKQMSEIIADLLRLARIARVEMRQGKVDLSQIAREVAAHLQSAATERHGLRNMQTRGAEAHGSLEVRSSAEGTVVRFSLDIEAVKVSPP